MQLTIVDAGEPHLGGIAEIYADAVRDSPATFDLEPPGIDHWRGVLADCDPAHGWLVRLLATLGFERVGTFEDVGEKFGRLWSVTWYQRQLAAGAG